MGKACTLLTIAVPLHARLVALQVGVDDDGAAQAHGLALPAEGDAKRVHDVCLEGDAILRHQALWGTETFGSEEGQGGGGTHACVWIVKGEESHSGLEPHPHVVKRSLPHQLNNDVGPLTSVVRLLCVVFKVRELVADCIVLTAVIAVPV